MDVDYSGQCRDNKYDSCVIEEDIQTMQMYSVYCIKLLSLKMSLYYNLYAFSSCYICWFYDKFLCAEISQPNPDRNSVEAGP